MSDSLEDFALNSSDIGTKDASHTPVIGKPTEKHPSVPLKTWLKKVNAVTNEMSTNEQARRAVAKRLS